MKNELLKSSLILLLVLVVWEFPKAVRATLSPGQKAPKLKPKVGPIEGNIFERHLLAKEPLASDILLNHGAYCSDCPRNFSGTTLGFVTPWNSHGYDIAKTFGRKFDIISPVWHQLVKTTHGYEILGKHDMDLKWLAEVRRRGKEGLKGGVKIFPRIILEKFTERDYSDLLSDGHKRRMANEVLENFCLTSGYDGIVLEFWSQLAGYVEAKFLITLVNDMAKSFKNRNLQVILVIPPLRKETAHHFNAKHLEELYRNVYAFALMTYDFSNTYRPGANAPLYWIRDSIEHIAPKDGSDVATKRGKILMGLNMYGYDFTPDGGGPIVADTYLKLLKHVKKGLTYDEHDVENYFEVRTSTGRHMVFYPTLHSINERIQLAQELGVGLSFWELGQGLDYFYDLF